MAAASVAEPWEFPARFKGRSDVQFWREMQIDRPSCHRFCDCGAWEHWLRYSTRRPKERCGPGRCIRYKVHAAPDYWYRICARCWRPDEV